MKKIGVIIAVLGCMIFLSAILAFADEQGVSSSLNQLNSELEKGGIFTAAESKSMEKPLKNMLEKGAKKGDLKKVIADLSANGVKGDDLKKTVNTMNDLVNSGESPKEAGNIVSRAAHQAKAEGLKGKDLAARVQAAIQQRKSEKEQLKKQKKEATQEMKQKHREMKEMHKGSFEKIGAGKGKVW